MRTLDIEPEEPATDKNSWIYKETRTPNYDSEIFEDIGHSVCIALLEWIQCNPVTRMPTGLYKNLDSIRKELVVQNSLYPYDQMKDLRKEVQKEKEFMKMRHKKIQA